MTEELLYFNGINGETGTYDLNPMTAPRLYDVLRGVAEPENIDELAYRVEQENLEHLGVGADIDPDKLDEAGWGVIFPADTEGTFVPAVKEALQPLLKLRQEQAGKHFRIYDGVKALRPGESKLDYLIRLKVPPADLANPKFMPYYLLLVGSPEQISYRFQSQLDVQYAVGRIYFETLQEYANYAASVVAAETGQVRLAKRAAFFSVMHEEDRSTTMSTTRLMEPLAQQLQPEFSEGGSAADWHIAAYMRDAATKAQLANLLGGADTPALLFTGSHGVAFPTTNNRQVPHQGALICHDWPGPDAWKGRGPVTPEYYFAGDDLSSDANLAGMMAFFFACYGGGTPLHDEFPLPGTSKPNQIASRPFTARLPMRMLGRDKGGAQAVIAHVERSWGTSFMWTQGSNSIDLTDTFKYTLSHLMKGKPVGSALEYFNSRYATWATDLSTTMRDVKYGLQVKPTNIASIWTAHNDARGYAILGDPAVRLHLAETDEQPQSRPIIIVQPISTTLPYVPQPVDTPSSAGLVTPADEPSPDSVHNGAEDSVDHGINYGLATDTSFEPTPKEDSALSDTSVPDQPMPNKKILIVSTYTAAGEESDPRSLFARSEITLGTALETTVYGADASENDAMLNLHEKMVSQALGQASNHTPQSLLGSIPLAPSTALAGMSPAQQEEHSIPIAPVEPPQPVGEADIPFLPEVTDFLWVDQARDAFKVDGSGLTVAVLDTGLNAEHVDFAGRIVTQVNYTPDNNGVLDDATDGNGHGTNVGGIITANGPHTGIAPGARIIPMKVLANQNGGDFAWVDEALQWVLDHRVEHNITAVCMSLGDGGNYTSDNFTILQLLRRAVRQKIQALRAAKVAVVIAAGNDFFPHNSQQGMSFPAIIRECVSVGAIYDSDGGGFSYESGARSYSSLRGQITPFSQRLHSSVSAATATDIFSPGAPVTASGIGNATASSTQHGTSQAAPVITGLILLLQEFYQRWQNELPTVDQLVEWLQQGGVPIYDGDDENDNVQHTHLTYTRADALSALDAARRSIQLKELAEKMG